MHSQNILCIQGQQADSKLLPTIIDEQGAPVDLAVCMAEERTSLCQACQPTLLHTVLNCLAVSLLGNANHTPADYADVSWTLSATHVNPRFCTLC